MVYYYQRCFITHFRGIIKMRISIQGQIYQVINFAHYFDKKNWHCNYLFSPDTSSGRIKADKKFTYLKKFVSAQTFFFFHDEAHKLSRKKESLRLTFVTYGLISVNSEACINLQKHFEFKRIRAFHAY